MRTPDRRKVNEVPASRAKNSFGAVLDQALVEGMVAITKHDRVRAVLLSIEEFERLSSHHEDTLHGLEAEFDALVSRMQSPKGRAAAHALFEASPESLGQAAVRRAKKRS